MRQKAFFRASVRLAFCVLLGLMGGILGAQSPATSLAYVYPAGASRGTTVQIVVAGQAIKGAKSLLFTGDGISARVTGYFSGSPLNRVQEDALKEYLKARLSNRNATAGLEVPQLPPLPEFADLASKSNADLQVLQNIFIDKSKMAKAPMSELLLVEVKIAENASPGNRELRVIAPQGVSNPLVFQVGVLPELAEPGPFKVPLDGHKPVPRLPAVLNGQIMPGQVDSWDVELQKGQELLLACQARNLIPYLADAVPGWFQAVLAVLDERGCDAAYADDNGSDPDPVLRFIAPADGRYTIVVRDSIYRGRYDFVYRLVVGTPAQTASQLPVPSRIGARLVPVAGTIPAQTDTARTIAPGQSAQGCIGTAGQTDSWWFEAQAGKALSIKVAARVSGSALDSFVRVFDESGKLLAENDDSPDALLGLLPHHADSRLLFVPPAAGRYRVMVGDAARTASPAHDYQLSITPAAPAFRALTHASGLALKAGGTISLPVQLVRLEGWTGPVELVLDDPPEGITLVGGQMTAEQSVCTLHISASEEARPGLYFPRLEARGQIGGQPAQLPAIPADLRMQAFGLTHLVPAQQLVLQVTAEQRRRD